MKSAPKIGTVGETTFVVEPRHCIEFAGDGMPEVLSTPTLIGLLERTSREALYPYLETDERSVGVEIELRHLSPVGRGQTVTCTARVIHVERRLITFQIDARDARDLIARGVHKRAVVRVGEFARRVQTRNG